MKRRKRFDFPAAAFCFVAGIALPAYDTGVWPWPVIIWPAMVLLGTYSAIILVEPHFRSQRQPDPPTDEFITLPRMEME